MNQSRGPQARTVVLLLDDSLTSTRLGGDGAVWKRSQARAREVLGELDAARGDRVGIMTLGGGPLSLVMPPTSDISSAIEAIRTHEPVDAPARLGPSVARVVELLGGEPTADRLEIIALSEWLTGSIDRGGEMMPELPRTWTFAASGPSDVATSNTTITGFVAAGPLLIGSGLDATTSFPVTISLARYGPAVSGPASTTVAASLTPMAMAEVPNANDVARETMTWAPGQTTADVSLSITLTKAGGVQTSGVTDWFASVSIGGDHDSIPADNARLMPLTSRDKLDVLIVGRRGDPANVAAFSPVDWYTLALTPEVSGRQRRRDGASIRVSSAGADVLRTSPPTADAVLIAEPDELTADAWRSLRVASDSGALIVVSPPIRGADQRWADTFAAAFGLELSLGRTPRAFETPIPARAPAGVGADDLLKNLRPELAELLPSVAVSRVLEVVSGRHRSLLELSDEAHTPVMLELLRAETKPTDGRIILLTTAPELSWTNLVATPLMVPLMQELVRSGSVHSRLTATSEAGGEAVLARLATEMRQQRTREGAMVNAGGGGSPARTMPPVIAGIYDARDANGQRVSWLGVQPSSRGSNPTPSDRRTLDGLLSPLATQVRWLDPLTAGSTTARPETDRDPAAADAERAAPAPGNPVSFWLLAAALLVALIEALLARFFSHAGRTDGTEPPLPAPTTGTSAA
ncbi:MAG: VWA domain-containing protein [bacterium]|nr:VWA domain-containing protein [bacterium]